MSEFRLYLNWMPLGTESNNEQVLRPQHNHIRGGFISERK